ncbi:MAG: low temperature requirement protein A [Acidimicrobiales bacterium]
MTDTTDSADVEDVFEELDEKAAHPLELFFDLVFVFAFTQVVSLVVHDLQLSGVLHGALVLGLLWWGWGTWTWATNVVDLEPRLVRVAMLASMLGVFVMGFAVPTAFEGDGMWVAAGYVWVRLISAIVMFTGTRDDPVEQEALRTYMPFSFVAPVIMVIGAAVGGESLQWWWLTGLLVELAAAVFAGRADWHIDAAHFAERHGLIMIIALGEAIIAVGVALTDAELVLDTALATQLGVGLAGACALWWAYFDRLQGVWEHALRTADEHQTGHLARDVYSMLHYPMIVGIVFYAIALEEAFLHPDDPLDSVVAALLVSAFALYLIAMAVATWRCWRTYLYERVIGVAAIAALVWLWDGSAKNVVFVSTMVIIVSLSFEYWRFRDRIRGTISETA